MTALEPATYAEVQDALRDARTVRLEGLGRHAEWGLPVEAETAISLRGLVGVVEHDVADHVVVVRAGTTLAELQAELAPHGQCVPFGVSTPDPGLGSTLGGLVAMNLPHTLAGQLGSWREWVIGMRVVLADGTLAKCGSKAVKNVAGFDVEKLLVGARGTLGAVVEVTLRTFAARSLLAEDVTTRGALGQGLLVVQRTLPADFARACQAECDMVADRGSCTLWLAGEPIRRPGDWILRRSCGPTNMELKDPTLVSFVGRAKALLDPKSKLSPGAMGVV